MAPQLIVFLNPPLSTFDHEKAAFIITNLQRQGYEPRVDQNNGSCYSWFKMNYLEEHRMYNIGEEHLDDYTVDNLDEEMDIKPDLTLSFDAGVSISPEEWTFIFQFLEYTFFGKDISETSLNKARELLPLPVKQVKLFKEGWDEEEPKYPDHYSLETHFVEKYDTMIYQVIKPHTDLPYTTITKNYSKVGHEPFFTSLFICSSWGVCKQDIGFLFNAWKELKMEGDFDLDRLLKERTEKCYPTDSSTPEPEPIVYRRTIQEVLERLEKKRNGLVF